ncbi:RICIN domain-containing protein [Undibacterium sp. CY18W]|uniref:RICIN domain-containing protein n=1 Tax=Undibacterium hunanense TaxID=2762292 RepID=A0ABR6ZU98_9BURK|nr:insecticidal delta-endotoxin Cry8Ea1 family protein [Undibacterium hunanense]MBC3919199.1 RICIN domain-containing protein [Undibacterium hunanense]
MAFDPIPGQFFLIRSVKSGLVLQVRDKAGHRGAEIVQDEMVTEEGKGNHQHFQFVSYQQGYYSIRSRSSGKSFDVTNLSQDNGAAVIQWDVTPHQGNQQFSLHPAGNNRYFISAHHSLKFLMVNGNDKPKGARLVQDIGKGADYQFTFEPVPPVAARGLREIVLLGNDQFREGALSLIGEVPKVGGAIKFVTDLLWPNSRPPLIEQVRDYVVSIAREMIEESYIRDLGLKLSGFKNQMDQYSLATPGTDKGQWMTSMVASLEAMRPYFFDQASPEKTLPHLVIMGTLHLGILRERYDNYEKIYDKPHANPAELLKDLQKRVALYVEGCQKARANTLRWRLDKIGYHREVVYENGHPHHDAFVATDSFDGWKSYSGGGDMTYQQAEALAVTKRDARLALIKDHFSVELDTLLSAALLWRYYDPAIKEKARFEHCILKSKLYGEAEGTYFELPSKPQQASPIWQIVLFVREDGQVLNGIRIRPRDGSGEVVYGSETGTKRELYLDQDEAIVAAWGNEAPLNSLYLFTNKWKDVGGGQRQRGNCWSSEPPVGASGQLDSLFGYTKNGVITGIGFNWRCTKQQ